MPVGCEVETEVMILRRTADTVGQLAESVWVASQPAGFGP
jgi:hypothetical protein